MYRRTTTTGLYLPWIVASLIILPPLLKVATWWLIAPLGVRKRQTLRRDIALLPLARGELTGEARDRTEQETAALAPLGFSLALTASLDGTVTNIRSSLVLFVNPSMSCVCSLTHARASTRRSVALSFRTEFEDGTELTTGSTRSPGVYSRDPAIDSLNFSWIDDSRTLLEIHRRRLARHGPSPAAVLRFEPDHPERYTQEQWRSSMARREQGGYQWFDAERGVYRYTLKGAYLFTWRLLWPLRPWRARRREGQARRAWAALGMDDYRPSPASVAQLARPAIEAEPLGYQAQLGEGELRQQLVGDRLIVRMGMPLFRRQIARRWVRAVMLLFWLVCAAFSGLQVLLFFQYRLLVPGINSSAMWRLFLFMALPVFFVVTDIIFFSRLWIRSSGTATLTAGPEGLTFDQVPSRPHSGQVVRQDFKGLALRIIEMQWVRRRKTYALYLLRQDRDREQILLIGSDLAALTAARLALLVTMGIDQLTPPMAELEAM